MNSWIQYDIYWEAMGRFKDGSDKMVNISPSKDLSHCILNEFKMRGTVAFRDAYKLRIKIIRLENAN